MKDMYINPHLEKWNKYVIEMNKALLQENIDLAESLHQNAISEYEAYKKDLSNTYKNGNFGIANYIFENVLPQIFKTNKKVINEFMTTIKEDKNLYSQFKFYEALNKCTSDNVNEYLNEAIDLVSNGIDYKSIKKSNQKLMDIINENHLIPSESITKEQMDLFENCDYILSHKKCLLNLNEYNSKLNDVASYVKANIKPLNETKTNVFNMISEFDKKYGSMLNEEEKSFVKEIMDFKSGINSSRKKKFFESLKSECLAGVYKLLESCNEDEKNDLNQIKEEIQKQEFNEENLVKDVAKLLELRDIILDK